MLRYLLFLFCLILLSCDKSATNEELNEDDKAILGSWQQVEYSYSIGGPQLTEEVKNGVILEFKENLNFWVSNEETGEVIKGVFSFSNDTLVRIYNYDDDRIEYISKSILTKDLLQLVPIGPTICIEGCSETYKRL